MKKKGKFQIYKKLFNNIALFTLADLVTKGTTFLLLPMFTFYFTQHEYGMVDILQVSMVILIPFISISLSEAVLRYTLEKKYEYKTILSNVFFINIGVIILLSVVFSVVNTFWVKQELYTYVFILLCFQVVNTSFLYFMRGINNIKGFVINSILVGFLTILLTWIFIGPLDLGVAGFIYASLITQIISLLYYILFQRIYVYISFKDLSFEKQKQFLQYSFPLMPNSILWWLVSSSAKYFILIFMSVASNGVYAVATKMGSILNLFNGIFFKAWQVISFEKSSAKESSQEYSETLRYYQQFLFIIAIIMTIFIKDFFDLIIGKNFFDAWIYVPILLLGGIFSSLSSFLGTVYLVEKDTKKVFSSTIFSVLVSLGLNILLIPYLGLLGAALANVISFMVLLVKRMYDTRRYIKIIYNYTNFILNMFVISFLYIALLMDFNYEIVFKMLGIVLLLVINNNFFAIIFRFAIKFFNKKEGKND